MEKVRDFMESVIDDGLLCEEYEVKYHNAKSKRQVMDIVLDANGMSFLQEMGEKGHKISYDAVVDEYGKYINGNYVRDNDGYTSEMYCKHEGYIEARCTATVLLGCTATVRFTEPIKYLLYCDDCDIRIESQKDARVYVQCWGDTKVDTSGNENNVILKRKEKTE